MNRILGSAALLLLSAPAFAGGTPGLVWADVCDSMVRSAADDVACACAKEAASAESDAARTGAAADYSRWWSGLPYGGGRVTNAVDTTGSTAADRANGSCFDLQDHVNSGTTALGNAYLDELEAWAKAGAASYGHSFRITTSDSDGNFTDDWVDAMVSFGTETTTDGPSAPVLPFGPPLIIDELDPQHTVIGSEEGPMGNVQTMGRSIVGGFLSDVNHDQMLDAVVFLEDGGNYILVGPLHPGADFQLPPM